MEVDPRVRVLIVEDNDGDARLLREVLREAPGTPFDVTRVSSLAECLATLVQTQPGAILLDLHLTDSDGLQGLRAINTAAPNTTVVIMTGLDDSAIAAQALREGAQDYLLKDELANGTLLRSLRYAMERKENESQLRAMQEQLLQAQRMEAIGRLAGGIAHDFNNLLTVINGYARLLQEGMPAADPRSQDLAAIVAAADRATTLTQQLLAYSRKQVMQMRVVDLNPVLTGMTHVLRRTLGDRIDLRMRLDETNCPVELDPRQFEQVMLHLATNARDAMPRGGWLEIRCRRVQLDADDARAHQDIRPGEYVQISVTDNGSGMDEHVLQHMFDPFFTTKPFGQGTGLGLSIVHGIVKQSHGHVWATSKPAIGTSVHLAFPPIRGSIKSDTSEIGPAAQAGTELLLLVENNPADHALIQDALSQLGYRVLSAADGHQAINVLRGASEPPALVVLNCMLPDLSGAEVAEGLRALHPALKVLFISAETNEPSPRTRAGLPSTAFITRPFTPSQLAGRIRALLTVPAPLRQTPVTP